MGKLIEYRFVVEVNGYVASKPLASMEDAMDAADDFARPNVRVSIVCYWSGKRLWEHAHRSGSIPKVG